MKLAKIDGSSISEAATIAKDRIVSSFRNQQAEIIEDAIEYGIEYLLGSTANSEQRTANSEQRTANSEQRTANRSPSIS
jgi:hypothetical protein